MANANKTHVTLLVDRSGSMSPIWADTVGSIKQFVKEQEEVPGQCSLDIVTFDNPDAIEVELSVPQITKGLSENLKLSAPRGGTALFDAISITMDKLGQKFAGMAEEDRPGKVVFAIVTDGGENSSREFKIEDVKSRITHQETKYGWGIVYLGANQDAFEVGSAFGLAGNKISNYNATAKGMAAAYGTLTSNVSYTRSVADSAYASFSITEQQQQTLEKTK